MIISNLIDAIISGLIICILRDAIAIAAIAALFGVAVYKTTTDKARKNFQSVSNYSNALNQGNK